MIATRSVERGRSALHKSTQLHSRPLNPLATHCSRLLLINNHNNSTNINWRRRRHDAPAYRLFQQRHAHTGAPFGWTNLHENEEPQTPPARTIPQDQEFVRPQPPQERFRLARRPETPGNILGAGPLLPKTGRPGSVSFYHAALKALLSALRRGDTFKLYLCLMDLVLGHETEGGSRAFTEVMATIPPTTFSEILRNFDPHRVAEEIDTAPGMNISYGVAVYTPLGELVNKWGVKTLYVRILRRLLHIQLARRNAGLLPLVNDYVVLMRCAGATSNIRAAKDIWQSMSGDKRSNIRHSEAYSEFLKARYLSEKIYANNDLSRLRLRPLDMHRSSLKLKRGVLFRLRDLTAHVRDRRKHRFGFNMHERFYDEPLTRVLRKRDPLTKLNRTVGLRGLYNNNEEIVCAFLKANGRIGGMVSNSSLLKQNWGIFIRRDRRTGAISIEGGHTYPPDSPRKPTAALLDAVVHSYGSMGEITMAVRLLDYISQRFSIPVPDSVWSDLIEYARIMQSKPAATEWAVANFPHRVAKPDQLLEIWNLCTQAPYSFRPGAKDYYNLIKSLVRRKRSMLQPIEALRQIKPLYDNTVDACEQAWCELVQTTEQAVPNHNSFRRYKALQARRNHMWYMFHYSISLMLKGMQPDRIDDESAVRQIPKLLGDFEPFLPRRVSYLVATGLVEFSPDPVHRRGTVDVRQTILRPLMSPEVEMAAKETKDDHSKGKNASGSASPAPEEDQDIDEDDTTDPDDKPVSYDEQSPGHVPAARLMTEPREVEKPAYLYRPPFSGPSDKVSILSIRRDGGEFTGFHGDPKRRHFAAYRVRRQTRRVAGVPVDLDWSRKGKGEGRKRRLRMVDEVMRMRT